MPIYIKLFNIIFDSGKIPENWNIGIMIPIFKNKGSRSDPKSYRGVTLNPCFSKTFSSIQNNRLNIFSDTINLISGSQAGIANGFPRLIMYLYYIHWLLYTSCSVRNYFALL